VVVAGQCWAKSLRRIVTRDITPAASAMIAATSKMRFRPVANAAAASFMNKNVRISSAL